jgi:hypothetical protein
VKAVSAPSAKLDFPEPLRPTTRVTPGSAFSGRRALRPMPRKPLTLTESKNTRRSGCGPPGVCGAVPDALCPPSASRSISLVASARVDASRRPAQPGERRGSAAVVESLPVELRGLVVIVVFRDLGDNMG